MLKNEESEEFTPTRPQPKISGTLAGARGKVMPPGGKVHFPLNLVEFNHLHQIPLKLTKFLNFH